MIALETKTPSLRSASPTAKKASLPYSGAHLAPPIDETWNQKGPPVWEALVCFFGYSLTQIPA